MGQVKNNRQNNAHLRICDEGTYGDGGGDEGTYGDGGGDEGT